MRYNLVATVEGLPAPASLGDYTTFVAWAYTASLDSAKKLGVIRNGRTELGELSYMQFRIIVTAERSSNVTVRSGLIVLRGTSPSMRLVAHRDLKLPLAPGLLPDPPASAAMRTSHAHGDTNAAGGGDVSTTAMALPARMRVAARDTITLAAGRTTVRIGRDTFDAFAYGRRIPGPAIEVAQHSEIFVRLTNALSMPTSIHWHGIRLDNANDGTPGLTQTTVAPGRDFLYALRFPDAGVFWYHPHVREDVQLGRGLLGNIIVRPADPNYYVSVAREELLTLSDVLTDSLGAAPFGVDAPTHALMGRFGNVFLINGRSDYRLNVTRGDVVRFFVTNAANARTYNLSIPGVRLKLVAGDASKFQREEWVESIVIGPSERYTVEAQFTRAGRVPIVNGIQAIDHMVGVYWAHTDTIGVIDVANAATPSASAPFNTLRANADVDRGIAPFRGAFAKRVDRELVLTMRMQNVSPSLAAMLTGANAPLDWNDGMPMMNAMTTPQQITWVLRDPVTGRENMEIDWTFRRGDVVKLRVFNDPASPHAMAHPIHLHGQRFLVISRDGVATTNLVWKDTAIIPAGQTVELLAEMANPGKWMLHCHIAEHLSGGMMAAFTVQ